MTSVFGDNLGKYIFSVLQHPSAQATDAMRIELRALQKLKAGTEALRFRGLSISFSIHKVL